MHTKHMRQYRLVAATAIFACGTITMIIMMKKLIIIIKY